METRKLGDMEVSAIGMGVWASVRHTGRKKEHIVPIPGMRNDARIVENLGAWDIVLTDEEYGALTAELNKRRSTVNAQMNRLQSWVVCEPVFMEHLESIQKDNGKSYSNIHL